MVGPSLDRLVLDDREYWHVDTGATPRHPTAAYLLPNFDEYTVAYRERALIVPAAGRGVGTLSAMDALGNVIVIDGRIAGTWKRSAGRVRASIDVRPYRPMTGAETRLIARAAERYGRFLGTPVSLALAPA